MLTCAVVVFGSLGAAPLPGAAAADCRHSDAVFYTTDTSRLATELGKAVASCTDYYLSITPRADHGPRGGAPLTAIHAVGSFHALADIHMYDWQKDVSLNYGGDWYAAGVAYRSMMTATGYLNGDTWAIDEVGEPSSAQPFADDVVKGNDQARRHLLDFVHGLYDGPTGSPPLPGLVFAASPLHVTSDLSQYARDLTLWYADSSFWSELSRYVRFWAQETYADGRAWGVADSSLAERSAYLNDYFLHGSRDATADNVGMEAVRGFFAAAYTPLGNASYRYTPLDLTTGIGYGDTDVGLDGMLHFVSEQTYALRSSTSARFGFAVVPKQGSSPTGDWAAIDDRFAAAIQASATDAGGACGASEEWCGFIVDGAQFNTSWRAFADTTSPTIVPQVDGTVGHDDWYTSNVTVGWDVGDLQSPVLATSGCDVTTITADTTGATLTCTAMSFGGTRTASVTVKRDATPPVLTVPAPGVVADATSPAGAVVTFAATAVDTIDPTPVVQCVPASGSVFSIGPTNVICTATDEAGNHATLGFTVHVRGPDEQVAALIDSVVATGAKQGIVNSLTAKLRAVQEALAIDDAGTHGAAVNILGAFINEVNAQSGKALTPEQGSQLAAAAQQIQAALGS